MTDLSDPEARTSGDETIVARAYGEAELPARERGDYRAQLRSRRWNAAPLRNPEVQKTDPRIAVAFIALLCAITLAVIVIGYASGFWALPSDEAASGAVAALELLA